MSDTKQAVILVHGMGQQVPMETLRSFVDTMWVSNKDIHARLTGDPDEKGNPVWWKPDNSTGSLELSRIATRHVHDKNDGIVGLRTDFYELYWADVTEGNTLAQLKDWFFKLLVRWPREVPPHARPLWFLLWLATLALVSLWIWKALAALLGPEWGLPNVASGTLLALTIIAPAFLTFAISYFGDVARYTRAAPANIVARRAARERGLALLRALSDNPDYERIVLVGHSLGSILAYDLVKFFWSECESARTMEEGTKSYRAWRDVEEACQRVRSDPTETNLIAYRAAQTSLFEVLCRRPGSKRWIISDLVTLGSPLTHAEFLLERTHAAFALGVKERRFPTSPPVSDDPNDLIYRDVNASQSERIWRAHHATPFATVHWKNIYDPRSFIIFGDFVSGLVAPLFGPAVVDQDVLMRHRLRGRIFTHTLYWTETNRGNEHLSRLREALNLVRPAKATSSSPSGSSSQQPLP